MAKFIFPIDTPPSKGMYEFKKTINLDSQKNAQIRIFASSRYILYINNEYICEGPCRSSEDIRYFDTISTNALKKGKNEISVKVMHLTEKMEFTSVFKSNKPLLIAEIKTDSETFSTDSSWECLLYKNHNLLYPNFWTFVPPFEEITDTQTEFFELSESKDFDFSKSFISEYGTLDFYNLKPRPIPMIYPRESVTLTPVKTGDGFIEYDAGCYVTAKLSFDILKNNYVKILYSECYEFEDGKSKRDDISGFLKGSYDVIHPKKEDFTFNPFWFRAFRYIRIESKNPDAIKNITAKRCNYPLDIKGTFECSNEYYNKMQEISINTMLCCTHEIFVDCPHFEQQQYIMDSAIESAVLMRMSDDTKMIKKCISEFAAAQHPTGLLAANYPCAGFQAIPGFSFFFVLLLKDYLEYSKDIDFAKQYLGTIEKIFTYFENNLNKDGLISRSEYWDFVDWVPEWWAGIPHAKAGESLTIYNLYYLTALKAAEFICEKTGKDYLATEYNRRHSEIKDKLFTTCYDKDKSLFKDGSNTNEYSMHTIIWAILADAVTGDDAKEMAKHLLCDNLLKSSFSMNYYLFRALEKCGSYSHTVNFFKGWQEMIDMHCTTWCENPDAPRSECHGWSSAPLYEFSANILGVKYSFDDTLTIAPTTLDLTYAKGAVPTRFGIVDISWTITDNIFTLSVKSPENIAKKIILPNGEVKNTTEADFEIKCDI